MRLNGWHSNASDWLWPVLFFVPAPPGLSGVWIRPSSHRAIFATMITHRYHLPHYQQVAVYFWPILFFQLWRVDLWQEDTGRLAFVIPDKYGRAWVPYFEGMSMKPHVNDMNAPVYKPADVEDLCPGWIERTLSPPEDASVSWGLRTSISQSAIGMFMPWTPAFAGVGGDIKPLEPG